MIDEPFGLLVDTGLDSETFNVIVTSRPDAVASAAEVQRCRREFGARRFVWLTGPSVRSCFRDILVSEGLLAMKPEAAMAVDSVTPTLAASSLEIVQVTNAASLDSYVEVISQNWTPPAQDVDAFYAGLASTVADPSLPLLLFVGRTSGQPVSTAEIALGGDGVAGLYNVATLNSERGQGFGTAMTLHALEAARRLGMKRVELQASRQASGLYERVGFRSYGLWHEHASG